MIHIYKNPQTKETITAHFFQGNVQYEVEGKRTKTVVPVKQFDAIVKGRKLELVQVKK